MKSPEAAFLTKTDAAVEILRGEIMRGELRPGAPLQQEAVARRLGLSSTPVREAFVVLESEGLVERRAHHGVAVAHRNPADMLDVYEIRVPLEMEAFRRAIPNVDGAVIDELQLNVAEAEQSLTDVHASRRANARFHDILVQASQSPTYSELLRILIQRSLYAVPLSRTTLEDFVGHHRKILRALKTGDNAQAERAMADHLDKMTQLLRAALDRAQTKSEDGSPSGRPPRSRRVQTGSAS